MDRQQTIQQLQSIIKPYSKNPDVLENLSEETDFINDLKVNSANLVDIILDIEEAFDITIDNVSMEKMLDVKAALAIIEQKTSEK
ncbi:MAG TPA: acyl carrier protein [Flavobacterium sp.]|jgi:acyl carrier protein